MGRAVKFIEKKIKLPYDARLRTRARELRKAGVLSEVILWKAVRDKQFLGLDFDRQKIIDHYIVDFYIKRLGIVIEIDGSSHEDKEEYDQERDFYLKGLDLDVIHFTDSEVKRNLEGVLSFLKTYILKNYIVQ